MKDQDAMHDGLHTITIKATCDGDVLRPYYGALEGASCRQAKAQDWSPFGSPYASPAKGAHNTSPSRRAAYDSPTKPSFVTVMLLAELLDSLDLSCDTKTRKHAAHELRRYSRVVINRGTLGSLPDAVRKLVDLLTDEDPELRENAAGTLCNLCCSNDANKAIISQYPGAIMALIALLADNVPATTAAAAAATISNLAHDHTENQILIGRMPGATASLLKLLSMQQQELQPGRVRVAAARALECLSPHNQESIATEPSALKVITACLSDTEAAVRSSAAASLQRLAWLHAENQYAIAVKTPGALAGLAALLRDPVSPRAREHAAAAVANLAFSNDNVRRAVAQQPGMLTGLVELLCDVHPGIRGQAAAALKCLAAKNVENQTKIGAMCGAITGLLQMLKDGDAGVRQQAGDCLKCLAAAHTSNWFMIRKMVTNHDMHMVSYILSP